MLVFAPLSHQREYLGFSYRLAFEEAEQSLRDSEAECWGHSVFKGFDKIDGGITGHAIDLQLRTVMSALEAGVNVKDWECVVEALLMLQDAEFETRKQLYSWANN